MGSPGSSSTTIDTVLRYELLIQKYDDICDLVPPQDHYQCLIIFGRRERKADWYVSVLRCNRGAQQPKNGGYALI